MVNSHLTTLWEGWGIGSEGYGGGSYNHGWSGGPLTLLSQYVAGIAPGNPAYETFEIMPQPGNLKAIHCVTPTLKGSITLDFTRRENKLKIQVHVPPNTSATIGIPKTNVDFSKILVGNKVILQNKKVVANLPGVKLIGENDNYFLFNVKAGEWRFTCL